MRNLAGGWHAPGFEHLALTSTNKRDEGVYEMSHRDMTRKVALAWELYAVSELGMSAGRAIEEFHNWLDSKADEVKSDKP